MKSYVLGFLFSPSRGQVLLIEKRRPEWQAGKYNGLGGKIENGESSLEAMEREFKEEAGLDKLQWTEFAHMTGPGWRVFCFYATGDVNAAVPQTDEPLVVISTRYFRDHPVIPNLHWLIPMAFEAMDKGSGYHASIMFPGDH